MMSGSASTQNDGELIKYLIAGVMNTLAGYGVFLALFRWAHASPEWANTGGYVAGLTLAFVLNSLFVFKHHRASMATVLRFIAASLLAFALNQGVLMLLCRMLLIRPEFAQVFAMVAYTVTFYLLNKHLVFVRHNRQPEADRNAH